MHHLRGNHQRELNCSDSAQCSVSVSIPWVRRRCIYPSDLHRTWRPYTRARRSVEIDVEMYPRATTPEHIFVPFHQTHYKVPTITPTINVFYHWTW